MTNADTFKVKQMLHDPVFYATVVLPILQYVDPSLAAALVRDWPILVPFVAFIAGHLGIRMVGAHALGTIVHAEAVTSNWDAPPLESNPPTEEPAQ